MHVDRPVCTRVTISWDRHQFAPVLGEANAADVCREHVPNYTIKTEGFFLLSANTKNKIRPMLGILSASFLGLNKMKKPLNGFQGPNIILPPWAAQVLLLCKIEWRQLFPLHVFVASCSEWLAVRVCLLSAVIVWSQSLYTFHCQAPLPGLPKLSNQQMSL